jgi:hypothetical protein
MYRYRGRLWSRDDIERIRSLIAASPTARRAELARQVCEVFDWRRPDGRLKDMCCRDTMLRMQRDGLIELPPPRIKYRRAGRTFASEASDPQPPFEAALGDLASLRVELVARGPALKLWNE